MAVMRMSSSPVFSRVWAGVPLLHERGGMTNGLCGPGIKSTAPAESRRMKWLPLCTSITCLARCVCRGAVSPTPDNCLEHLGLYVLVFEHDCVVIGDGDGPVQVIDPRHISHWRTVAHTAQGWSDRRATRQSVSL